jgi:hypothetical protein
LGARCSAQAYHATGCSPPGKPPPPSPGHAPPDPISGPRCPSLVQPAQPHPRPFAIRATPSPARTGAGPRPPPCRPCYARPVLQLRYSKPRFRGKSVRNEPPRWESKIDAKIESPHCGIELRSRRR